MVESHAERLALRRSINELCDQISQEAAYYGETRDPTTFEHLGRHLGATVSTFACSVRSG